MQRSAKVSDILSTDYIDGSGQPRWRQRMGDGIVPR